MGPPFGRGRRRWRFRGRRGPGGEGEGAAPPAARARAFLARAGAPPALLPLCTGRVPVAARDPGSEAPEGAACARPSAVLSSRSPRHGSCRGGGGGGVTAPPAGPARPPRRQTKAAERLGQCWIPAGRGSPTGSACPLGQDRGSAAADGLRAGIGSFASSWPGGRAVRSVPGCLSGQHRGHLRREGAGGFASGCGHCCCCLVLSSVCQ